MMVMMTAMTPSESLAALSLDHDPLRADETLVARERVEALFPMVPADLREVERQSAWQRV
jgi:hypothetical protein